MQILDETSAHKEAGPARRMYSQAELDAAVAAERERLREHQRQAMHDPDTCNGRMAGEPPRYEPWCVGQRAEIERLRAALADAIECVESWSAYAPPYFGAKHNLAGDLARLRAYHGKT